MLSNVKEIKSIVEDKMYDYVTFSYVPIATGKLKTPLRIEGR